MSEHRPPSSNLLNEYLADRDEPCPRCGYNLHGLASDRCPECGDLLRLEVALVEPRLGSYVATLAAGCVGLGGGVLFSLIALVYAPSDWWSEPAAILLLTLVLLSGLWVAFVIRRRRWYRVRAPQWQQGCAWFSWLMVVTLFIVIIMIFEL